MVEKIANCASFKNDPGYQASRIDGLIFFVSKANHRAIRAILVISVLGVFTCISLFIVIDGVSTITVVVAGTRTLRAGGSVAALRVAPCEHRRKNEYF
jgi:hypothetical protein